MSLLKWCVAATLALLATNPAQAEIVITEIMYNPSGDEPETEWVEIYNSGPSAIDITGWYLFDEDDTFGLLSGILAPNQAAVVHHASDTNFADDWGLGPETILLPVVWDALANGPSPENENLRLADSTGTIRDTANYDDAHGWPSSTNGASIYLLSPDLDNNVGSNWALSQVGVDGAWLRSNAADIGSPGFVPGATAVPEPNSLAALAVLGVAGAARRMAQAKKKARP